MKVIKYSLGQLQANCYFIIADEECVIIDPADDASFILEEVQRRKLKLVGMMATHGHFDHIMAAGEIQMSFDVPLYIHKNDLFLVERLNETAKYFLGFDPHALKPKKIEYLRKGLLKFRNWKLEILFTPGHTPGSCCFYFNKEKVIFTGDTLFKGAIGRYDFSYSSGNDLKKSLNKLLHMSKETLIYPGHGIISTIEDEQNINIV